jgi:hypothetical protein
MCNGNHAADALDQRLTAQFRGTEFGNDDISVTAGGRGGTTQPRNDAAQSTIAGSGGSAIMDLPPLASCAPRTKSPCPPIAPMYTPDATSAFICPVKSTSTAELMETIRPSWQALLNDAYA